MKNENGVPRLFRNPTFDDCNHSDWLRKEMTLAPSFEPLVAQLTFPIHKASGKAFRQDVLRGIETAVGVIVANLLKAHLRDPNLYVQTAMDNAAFPKSDFNPLGLGIRNVRHVVNFMMRCNPPLIEIRGTNNNPKTHAGFVTRMRATRLLIDMVEEHMAAEPSLIATLCLTRNTFPLQPHPEVFKALFILHDLPTVRLKSPKNDDGQKSFLPIDPNAEVEGIRANLQTLNAFIQQHEIGLAISDEEFDSLVRMGWNDPDSYFDDDRRRVDPDIAHRHSLYRVFNNGRLDHGGRFYGGWWQNIPKGYRQFVTINGQTTVERDYPGMQARLLYAMEGLTLADDPYSLDGFPTKDRDILKRAFFKLINGTGRVKAPRKDTLPHGWTWKDIQDGLRARHAPIAKHFDSGIGIELQRTDSDIAERIMLQLMQEGVLALPVHDSFIVAKEHDERLKTAMQQEYAIRVGQPIGVEAEKSKVANSLIG